MSTPSPLLLALFALPFVSLQDAEETVHGVAAELNSFGVAVDLEELNVAVQPRVDATAGVAAELEGALGREGFETFRLLMVAGGAEPGADLRAALEQRARQTLEARAALYLEAAKTLIVPAEMAGGLAERNLEVGHALTVAARDAQVGFAERVGGTLEARLTLRALAHGEGQVSAALLMTKRDASDSGARSDDRLDASVWKMGLPPLEAATWVCGRRVVERALSGEKGRDAVSELWATPPVSTEQMLHPTKWKRDEPRVPAVPDWPKRAGEATLVHEDVLGELGIYGLLRETGSSHPKAWLASTGWEGDVLRRYETAGGDSVIVWRTAWDRPADAQQFAKAWRDRSEDTARLGGRVVDIVLTESSDVRDRWARLLESNSSGLKIDRADADGTEAIENEFHDSKRKRDYIVANEWRFPRYEMTLTIPVGWYEDERDGFRYLVRAKTAGYRDNLYVVTTTDREPQTAEQILSSTVLDIEQDHENRVTRAEVDTVNGVEVAIVRYLAHLGGHAVVHSIMIIPQERRRIAITISIENERFPPTAGLVDGVFENVRFGPIPLMDSE